ncbi:MAG TPA: T9SS type A sorting domain-containing protein [Bacteroidota bacterium]|nr:T9SS type A sorting domain-containing protein [Bacteroidota bacterium]
MKKIFFLTMFFASNTLLWAQWSMDSTQNNVVCNQSGQQNIDNAAEYQQCLCTDGAGGVIVVWQDTRNISAIYAQRINNGNLQWNSAGIPIATRATGSANFLSPCIISDGEGGAIIAWQRNVNGSGDSIYAQRVDGNGNVLWAANGVPIDTNGKTNEYAVMCTDGHAGAIIAWIDHIPYQPSIYVQHVDSSGDVQWATNGIAVRNSSLNTIYPQICTDGAGGAFIAWADPNTSKELAQRVLCDGSLEWTSPGLQLSASLTGSFSIARICSDGENGAIVAWHQSATTNSYNVYAQRIDGSGNILWASGGVDVCTQYSIDPAIASDGSGGMIAAWNDYRATAWNVYSQRINSSGSAVWTADGVPVVNTGKEEGGIYYYTSVSTDSSGGAFIAWLDERDPGFNYHLYAQELDNNGTPLWTTNGITVSSATSGGSQFNQQMMTSASAKAILVWEDSRGSGATNLYASAIGGGVLLPVELASFSAHTENENALLTWATATETNNYGFDIERENLGAPLLAASWSKIGFVPGSGSSAMQHQYSFTDPSLASGHYAYRLKQIDRNGAFIYSQSVEIQIVPQGFSLGQNYPNPFNPSTTVTFSIPTDGRVKLAVYDPLGREVAVLLDGNVKAGSLQQASFDGSKLSSGVYFARLQFNGLEAMRKMIMMK